MRMAVTSLEQCYRIADELADGMVRDDGHSAINFAGYTAQMYKRHAKVLAFACLEKNAAKRRAAVDKVVMELQANNESTAEFPSRSF